ncbi:MAG: hypothetical protein DRN15_11250 [Thermoprotei archaeon]|nr:MAG: hypothetical protein DRM97_08055 [Thermoprotei archaeon]RLF21403.1 MAG: hypothetical protein DRN15_11250 [Thermoprotei archaeon]
MTWIEELKKVGLKRREDFILELYKELSAEKRLYIASIFSITSSVNMIILVLKMIKLAELLMAVASIMVALLLVGYLYYKVRSCERDLRAIYQAYFRDPYMSDSTLMLIIVMLSFLITLLAVTLVP